MKPLEGEGRARRPRPHDRIVAAATRLFLEEGIQAVGVARIVQEAEVAQMTLYRQFGGKDGVVAAAVEQWSARRLGWVMGKVDRCGDDPEVRFAALWEALGTRPDDEPGGSLVAVAAIELRRVPRHPAWKAVTEHRMALRQLVEDLVKPLDVAAPELLAEWLYLLVEGVEAAAVAGEPMPASQLSALADAIRRAP
jgi:AcrR family transcriptional regulator